MYKFWEIECPKCGHRFVWLENSKISYYLYRRKGYDELLESTLCPECTAEMVVLKEAHRGIDINDSSIEVADILRGI